MSCIPPEGRGSMFLQNGGIYLYAHNSVSTQKTYTYNFTVLWEFPLSSFKVQTISIWITEFFLLLI
jgi:hypothetical protein